jgi:sodium-dependent dicarboxylate transporter 2/3/5
MQKTIRSYSGFFLGIGLFVLAVTIPLSSQMPPKAHYMAAITLLMAVWWISEAIPIAATSLLPIILYPLFKIMKAGEVTLSYGHHLVFLFLGGFIIAIAIERSNLHKRIALNIITVIGTNPRRIILGFMLATAFLSMWISNTATAMMMLPIALAISKQLQASFSKTEKKNFNLALMLAIAYSASIGGIGTLIGTPPNLVFTGILKANFPESPPISFIQWMLFAVPLVIVFLPVSWYYLVAWASPVTKELPRDNLDLLKKDLSRMGPLSMQERYVLIIFIFTAILWIFRADINLGFIHIRGWASLLGLASYVQDSTVAITMGILTFVIPDASKANGKLMNWEYARKIPWGILLLFGGGFALASGFHQSGLTQWLGSQLSVFKFMPVIMIIMLIAALTTFTTEFTSNTAMATTLLPIVASLGLAVEINPMYLMLPAAIASSTAFMLPVATPPNAIVFGSGFMRIKEMVRIGLMMNLIGLILTTLLVYLHAANIFPVALTEFPGWAH